MKEGKYQDLQKRFDDVMDQVRSNEQKSNLFQQMEIKLLSKQTLLGVCGVLVNDYCKGFKLDVINLLLIDGNNKMRELLEESEDDASEVINKIHFEEDYNSLSILADLPKGPRLDQFIPEKHGMFFVDLENLSLKSVAILPLYRHGILLGFIALGSNQKNRYKSDMATNFLERMALISAVSIENTVNIENLKRLSIVDNLTQLYNRRYFFQRLHTEVSRSLRHGHKVACLYIDIDHFKQVNDNHGHTAGDLALTHIANILADSMRDTDILARLGGEEFALLLPEVQEKGMLDTAERIRLSIENTPCELAIDAPLHLTVSIGLCMLDGDKTVGETKEISEILLNLADSALYKAKESGRNCYRKVDFNVA